MTSYRAARPARAPDNAPDPPPACRVPGWSARRAVQVLGRDRYQEVPFLLLAG